MHELVQHQLAIAPSICANHDAVPDRYRGGILRDDLRAARGFRQLEITRHRNAVDRQNADARGVTHADALRIGSLVRVKWRTEFRTNASCSSAQWRASGARRVTASGSVPMDDAPTVPQTARESQSRRRDVLG